MSFPVPALQLEALVKRFGSHVAVGGLSLTLPPGELYALLGPNGAGKTTTLRMIAGLLQPDGGDARIYGHSVVREAREAKRPLAYLPDEPLLYGKLRPLEYLEFVAGLWGVDPAEAAPRARELLRWLDLWEARGALTESFSRGMKQKLALAGALVHQPRLMILDEPLTGLDAGAARQVKDLLLDFVQQGGSVVLTTHILEVAERLAQRLGIIVRGQLVAEGSLEELRLRSGDRGGTLEEVFLDLVGAGKDGT
ncbi:ABC-2 type transport system ATP-binding protein [Deinobacterium chartae]|uniref:ABC-2 type transport system ATP-binding protein n=1 Tax=Deinobacterium chartae TaxID=521158 RepID=A0A841HXA4_9DEIO|nr:ABC transporter ATP-binding protein [Deinobacterium chartae]MBB6098161.1 ABC-2 type transport system ATP-binding protein [Deinobacterium chartae]